MPRARGPLHNLCDVYDARCVFVTSRFVADLTSCPVLAGRGEAVDNERMSAEGLDVALADASSGDQAAVGVLYRSLNPPLLRYLRHHVGPAAEDVASDVWLAIARRLAGFSGTQQEFRALLFTIARRRVIDQRRRWARQVVTVALTDECHARYPVEFEDATVVRMTAQSAVETLVRYLPPEQAEIVLLRVLGDLDVGQVAAIVGRSNGAVRVTQHRALQRLQQIFDRDGVAP